MPSNGVAALRPLLNRVTLWPRASACSTWKGPMNPVPLEEQDIERFRSGFQRQRVSRHSPAFPGQLPSIKHFASGRHVFSRANWVGDFTHASHERSRCPVLEPLDDRERGIAIA